MVCHEQTLVNKQGDCGCPENLASSKSFSDADSQESQNITRLRVPRGNGDLLITPPVSEVKCAVARNRELFKQNKTLADRRQKARLEALEIARQYTAAICPELPRCTQCSVEEFTGEKSFYVTGHQPEIFHPGVWVKNVLIDELAKQHRGISLNVIIDSDAVKSHSVKIPTEKNGRVVQETIPIDHWPIGVPWEELQVVDDELFESFAKRIEKQTGKQSENSLLKEFWGDVVSEVKKSGSVVNGLVAGRVRLERSLGINNLEVPISLLANSGGYRDFLAELILDADRLLQVYNCTLDEYRKINHIKSVMQPVPDLLKKDGWNELPIWIWNEKSKLRRSLFVQSNSGQLLLSDRAGWESRLDDNTENDLSSRIELVTSHLLRLQKQGVRFRTKALMTTAYLRLFIADWFVHGIGGAKYDEITDLMIAKFWNIPAPQFQVATGTLWLPIANRHAAPSTSSNQLRQQLRYAKENPEVLLTKSQINLAVQLLEAKKELITQQKQARTEGLTRSERRAKFEVNSDRYQQLKRVRSSLQKRASNKLNQLESKITQTRRVEEDLQVTNGREYPICCYPLETLQTFEHKIRNHE